MVEEALALQLIPGKAAGRQHLHRDPHLQAVVQQLLQLPLQRAIALGRDARGRLHATWLGRAVLKFLDSRYGRYVSEETTRRLEEAMRAVEEGRADYVEMLRALYEEMRALSRAD